MSIKLFDHDWKELLCTKNLSDKDELRIICPFIKHDALMHIPHGSDAKRIRVITRFKLRDCYLRASDLEAMEELVDRGAQVRGIKNLHAKLYIYGHRRAVLTSANITLMALTRNSEFGVEFTDTDSVQTCVEYFQNLWKRAGDNLTQMKINDWKGKIKRAREAGNSTSVPRGLGDYGADAGLDTPLTELENQYLMAPAYFIKFFATSRGREQRSISVKKYLEISGCHIACTYPEWRKPRRIPEGSVMYVSVLVDHEPDILIIGRGFGIPYRGREDDATPSEKKRRPFMNTWPRKICVYDTEFVNGTLNNGISLYRLMHDLDAQIFESTLQHKIQGFGNVNPRTSYSQQPDVQLSSIGAAVLNQRLEEAFHRHGIVPLEDYIHIP